MTFNCSPYLSSRWFRRSLALCALTLSPLLGAQESPSVDTAEPTATVESLPDWDAIYTAAAEDTESFSEMMAQLQTQDTPAWRMEELRLLNLFAQRDFEAVGDYIDTLNALQQDWDYSQSQLFKRPRELKAFVAGLKAQEASENGDEEALRQAVSDAFWYSPRWTEVFNLAALIEQFHAQADMSDVRLPLDLKITRTEGDPVTLQELLGDNKAILLDFWASWCGPCMRLMPELKAKSANLAPQGIVVAGMNTEGKEGLKKAQQVATDKGIDFPWLVEPLDEPYSSRLGIDSIPRMVLISPEGRVLFNGHPMDEGLNTALAELGVSLEK